MDDSLAAGTMEQVMQLQMQPSIGESGTRNMTQIVHATFDGQVLRPDEPLALLPNTRVVVTIETLEECSASPQSFLKTARSLNLEGPPDWSTRLDEKEATRNGA